MAPGPRWICRCNQLRAESRRGRSADRQASRRQPHAVAIQADVSKANDIRRLFEVTKRALSKVDVLINNAGILKTVPLTDSSDDQFDQTFAVNARDTINTLREARKRLNDGGRIINFSSTSLAR
jgi:3-oxoacyl-[acyl-carrier protein] reductase